jgi:hypothetical protein
MLRERFGGFVDEFSVLEFHASGYVISLECGENFLFLWADDDLSVSKDLSLFLRRLEHLCVT